MIGKVASLCICLGILSSACSPAATPEPSIWTETPAPSSTPLPPTVSPAADTPEFTPTPTLPGYETPDWFKEAVLYEIFVRSFADSDGDGIGDIPGITARLDYLASLGVTVIWLMPIYPSPSVHGYDVTNYTEVNPQYGTLADLQLLVEAAHDRGMRVILDFVPSHLSNQNPLFQEAYGNPEASISDWFVWTDEAHTQYAGFADLREMPRFNHSQPEVADYLVAAAKYWLDLDGDGDYQDGIDGFRVDNAIYPPHKFLATLRREVKSANPDSLLLGEVWVETTALLGRYYEDQFDALFDFPLYGRLQGHQDRNGDGLLARDGFPALLTSMLVEEAERFPAEAIVTRFLSNHDTNRIASEVAGDPARLRLAAALSAGLPGPVMVYYGEEIGMPGVKGGPPDWDNYRREPMDWYTGESGPDQTSWFKPEDRWNRPDDGISVEEQESDPDSLLNAYRQALNLRAQYPALGRGELEFVELEASGQGPWGFLRSTEGQSILALYNFSTEEQSFTVKAFPFEAPKLIDLLTGEDLPPASAGEEYRLTLPAAGALLLFPDS